MAIRKNAADFIYFMKDADLYWFKSLETLYFAESGITFVQRPNSLRDKAGNLWGDYSLMITKYNFQHYDGLGNMASGYYGSKSDSYDAVSKKWGTKEFSFGDDRPEEKALKAWDDPNFDNSTNANITFTPKHPGLAGDKKQTPDDTVDTWHNSRKSRLMVLEQNKYQLQLMAGAGIWKFLGQTCKIDLPSHQDTRERLCV